MHTSNYCQVNLLYKNVIFDVTALFGTLGYIHGCTPDSLPGPVKCRRVVFPPSRNPQKGLPPRPPRQGALSPACQALGLTVKPIRPGGASDAWGLTQRAAQEGRPGRTKPQRPSDPLLGVSLQMGAAEDSQGGAEAESPSGCVLKDLHSIDRGFFFSDALRSGASLT